MYEPEVGGISEDPADCRGGAGHRNGQEWREETDCVFVEKNIYIYIYIYIYIFYFYLFVSIFGVLFFSQIMMTKRNILNSCYSYKSKHHMSWRIKNKVKQT